MTLDEAIASVEGLETAARLNMVSTWRSFLQATFAMPQVKELEGLLMLPRTAGAILARIKRLAEREVDPRYENRSDVALAIYVLVLTRHDPRLGRIASEMAATAAQCWWLYQLLERLKSEPPTSGAQNAQIVLSYGTRLHEVVGGSLLTYDALLQPAIMRTSTRASRGYLPPYLDANGPLEDYRIRSGSVRVCAAGAADTVKAIAA